jgi:hypothetical protein
LAVTAQPIGGIEITDGGEVYASAPTIAFSSGTAAATAIISGELLTIDMSTGGTGYTGVPAVEIKGGNGTGATAKAVVVSGVVTSIEILSKGQGFDAAPTIRISGGGGSGATATAKISAKVVAVEITNGGSYSTLPTITFSGGGATTQATGTAFFKNNNTRAYAYTFVTRFGEESPPSPPLAVTTGSADGTWTLSDLQVAPTNSGAITDAVSIGNEQVRVTFDTTFGLTQYDMLMFADVEGMTDLNGTFRVQSVDPATTSAVVNLVTTQAYTSGGSWTRGAPHNTTDMKKRIYRTTGFGGDFLFVAEINASTASYVDTVAADDLGEVLPTADSQLPPKNLIALTSLPNGCLAGIAGNEVCLSDPYLPYSWPTRNRYTFSGLGVDLVDAGNSAIVLTDTYPIIFTGTDPEAMSPSTMQSYAPCATKRGVVNVGGGCLYPSYDGLWLAAPGRVEKLTAKLYREEEWKLLNPETFVASFADDTYYAKYTDGTEDDEEFLFTYSTVENDSVVRVEQTATTLIRNDTDGKLYLALDDKIYRWDSSPSGRYVSDWVSSEVQLPRPTNFSVAQIHADFKSILPVDTSVLEANQALLTNINLVGGELNGDSLLDLDVNGSKLNLYQPSTASAVQLSLYADNEIVYARSVSSEEPFRLPAGFYSEVYKIGLSTTVPVYNVTIAESVAELSERSA